MTEEEIKTNESHNSCGAVYERQNDDDLAEQDGRSDHGEEELTEVEIDALKRELLNEVSELEWEFKQAKEMLYNERIAQVENKLSQARSGTASEFLHVISLVQATYKVRLEIARHRMDFALEIANKECDNELQIAQCDMNERLLAAEEQIRLKLQENLCKLLVERSTLGLKAQDMNPIRESSDSLSNIPNYGIYLPSPNLEPRKKPVTLSPSAPRLIYQLPEDDIQADIEKIMAAVKKQKLMNAMAEINGGKHVY